MARRWVRKSRAVRRAVVNVPVTVKAASALNNRQTMMPASSFHESVVQRWPRVQLRFQVRSARPRHQMVVRAALV